jgi:hypothetical protein
MARLLFLAALSLTALSGCAANSYMGIGLRPGAADSAVQALARQAMAGDKQAQLKLGSYYQQAADGIVVAEPGAPSDRARVENIAYANEVFRIGTGSSDLEHYPSWRIFALTRAGELYRSASTDAGEKGLPEAARRLAMIEDAIFREQFVTRFNDPNDEACQNDGYSYNDWRRDAHFIVEGRLSHRFVREPKQSATESWVHWDDRHYEAEIEIARFVKWPDKFPRPQHLRFAGEIVDGQLVDEATGDRRGCRTWGPDGEADKEVAIVILQYQPSRDGTGRFEIVKTIRAGTGR